MTPHALRRAARWLGLRAQHQAVVAFDLERQRQQQRHAKHQRASRQRRDAQGRWVRQETPTS